MKRAFVFFLLVIAWVPDVWAQMSDPDSLEQVLKTTKSDTSRIGILAELSEICDEKDILKYAAECSTLCEKALLAGGEPRGFYLKNLSGSLNNIGYYYSFLGRKEKSLENYKRALKIDLQLGDKKSIAIQLNNIAVNLFEQGDFSQALEYYFKNLKVQEELDDKAGIAFSLSNIGYAYTNLDEYDKALEYYARGMKVSQSINDKSGMAQLFHNTGILYGIIGQEEKALEYLKPSLALYEELKDKLGICTSLGAISSVYTDLGEYTKAQEFVSRGLEISEKYGYKNVEAQCCFYAAEIFIRQGKMDKALPYAERSLELSKELGKTKEIGSAARALRIIYAKQERFKQAFDMFRLEVQMRDSTLNQTNKNELLKQELQYQYEKKELQTKLKQEKKLADLRIENERKLTRRNILIYSIIFLALLFAVSAWYIYKFFRQRSIITAAKNRELRQKLLLSQMNPHFIFNSVDNIQSLIYQGKDEEAISYLTRFSKLTRQILENSSEDYITLQEEVSMIGNYLSIQQLLYGNSFTYTVVVDEAVEKDRILLPPMLTQPFVENAVKHGLKNRKQGGFVEVRFYMEDAALLFEVNDNGEGLKEKDAVTNKSMSVRIVTERLQNSKAGKSHPVSISNRSENGEVKGVTTRFEIPYLYEN